MFDESDWSELVGRRVQILQSGLCIRTGSVDAVTATADGLWLAAYGVDVRTYFAKTDGYTVRLLQDADRLEPHLSLM